MSRPFFSRSRPTLRISGTSVTEGAGAIRREGTQKSVVAYMQTRLPVPVINPGPVALKIAEMFVQQFEDTFESTLIPQTPRQLGLRLLHGDAEAIERTAAAAFNTNNAAQLPELGQYVTHVVQLKYAKPSELVPVLTPFVKIPNAILPLDVNQILVLRDYAENVKRMLEMVERIDVAIPSEFEQQVIPIKYAKATEIASALNRSTARASTGSRNTGLSAPASRGNGAAVSASSAPSRRCRSNSASLMRLRAGRFVSSTWLVAARASPAGGLALVRSA